MYNEILFVSSVLLTAGATLTAALFGTSGLFGAIAVQSIMENLFVSKQIMLFGLEVTAADIYEIGIVFAINLLQELHGKKAARIGIGFFFATSIWFLVFGQIHLLFTPSSFDWADQHFQALLQLYPRMVVASTVTSTCSMLLDRSVFSYVRERFANFTGASLVAMVCSQVLDTSMFTILGLAGIAHNLWNIFTFSLIIKLMAICIFAPFCMTVKYLKKELD